MREREKTRWREEKVPEKEEEENSKNKIVFTCAGDVRDRVEPRDEQALLARAELDVDTEKGKRREKGGREEERKVRESFSGFFFRLKVR